jgi:hypothetical protein
MYELTGDVYPTTRTLLVARLVARSVAVVAMLVAMLVQGKLENRKLPSSCQPVLFYI